MLDCGRTGPPPAGPLLSGDKAVPETGSRLGLRIPELTLGALPFLTKRWRMACAGCGGLSEAVRQAMGKGREARAGFHGRCLYRWKRACTCSSRAPTAAARALCSVSWAVSGPPMVACSTSPPPSACSTSPRGERWGDGATGGWAGVGGGKRERARVPRSAPTPSDLWNLTSRRWQGLRPGQRTARCCHPAPPRSPSSFTAGGACGRVPACVP